MKSSLNNVSDFTLATLLKNISYRYFSNILKRDQEQLYFRSTFCGTPTFAKHHSRTAFKGKFETAIHNSVKYYSTTKKMQLILDLVSKIFLATRLNKVNSISVLYHRKIEQKLYTTN